MVAKNNVFYNIYSRSYDLALIIDDINIPVAPIRAKVCALVMLEPSSILSYPSRYIDQFEHSFSFQPIPIGVTKSRYVQCNVGAPPSFFPPLPPKRCRSSELLIINSNKVITMGHRKRTNFIKQLVTNLNVPFVVFGRGFRDFDSKAALLSEYQYSLAIENEISEFYVSEKLYDCWAAKTFPFYIGGSVVGKEEEEGLLTRLDLNDPVYSAKLINQIVGDQNVLNKYYKVVDDFFSFYISQLLFSNKIPKNIELNSNLKSRKSHYKIIFSKRFCR